MIINILHFKKFSGTVIYDIDSFPFSFSSFDSLVFNLAEICISRINQILSRPLNYFRKNLSSSKVSSQITRGHNAASSCLLSGNFTTGYFASEYVFEVALISNFHILFSFVHYQLKGNAHLMLRLSHFCTNW